MTIKLINLTLENFRKAKRYDLTLDGHDAAVYGANASGKSTLYDAWLWLLTGKTADGRSDAEIKTLGADGEPVHNLDHAVTAELLVDGKTLTLRRCLREKWTKKRGAVTAEFTGHETTYEVDGVPAGEKAFADKVATLVPQYLLPVLSNPSYFPARMKWQDRRSLLLQVAGDLTEAQVIAANPDLEPLQAALEGRSVDDAKAIWTALGKKINAELLTLPARIDEANRSSVTDEDVDSLQDALCQAQDALRRVQQAEADAEAGGGLARLRIKLQEAEAAVRGHEGAQREKVRQATAGARAEHAKANQAVADAEVNMRRYEREVASLKDGLERAERTIQAKRVEWEQASASELPEVEDKVCPTCGHKLSAKATKDASDKAQDDFNARKAELLAAIMADAETLKRGKARIEGDLAAAVQKLDDARKAKADAALLVEQAAGKLAESEMVAGSVDGSLAKLQQAVADLNQQLADAGRINAEAVAEAHKATVEAQDALAGLMQRQAAVEAAEQAKARVAELEAKLRDLAQDYERVQGLLYLAGQFVVAKVNGLTDKINGRFRHARFQLFDTQINGGIAEMCEVTFMGVPYSDLNAASKINVALDIVNVIGAHFGISLPLFVDGAESYQKLIPVQAQTVRLVVADDKKLRVERVPASERQESKQVEVGA